MNCTNEAFNAHRNIKVMLCYKSVEEINNIKLSNVEKNKWADTVTHRIIGQYACFVLTTHIIDWRWSFYQGIHTWTLQVRVFYLIILVPFKF